MIISSPHLAVCLFLISYTHSANAIEIELTKDTMISGNTGSLSISPYHPLTLTNKSPNKPEHVLYAIDYDALKQEIKTYQQIYVTGQILHGYLMIKMKPKFVK